MGELELQGIREFVPEMNTFQVGVGLKSNHKPEGAGSGGESSLSVIATRRSRDFRTAVDSHCIPRAIGMRYKRGAARGDKMGRATASEWLLRQPLSAPCIFDKSAAGRCPGLGLGQVHYFI